MTKRKNRDATVRAVASHIAAVIDGTDWAGITRQINPCRTCPARDGPHLIGDDIGSFCTACPLRPLLMALADLDLRQQRRQKLEDDAQ